MAEGGADLGTHAETLQQLKAARQWLKFLVDEFDLELDETAFHVDAVSPEGRRTVAVVTLADSLSHIDACLAAQARPRGADPSPAATDGARDA